MNRARWRRPKPVSALVFLAMILVFLSAARWQWQRAEFKAGMAAALAQVQAGQTVRDLTDVLRDSDLLSFQSVRIAGVLDTARIILLDNQIRDGQYGVRVFAPMPVDSTRLILVELGWVAADRSRQQRPVLPAIEPRLSAEALLAAAPATGLQLGKEPWPVHPEFPLLRSRINLAELRTELGWTGLLDRVAILRPDSIGEFRTDWKPPGLSAEKHRGYALQWLSFAIGTLVFFILWHRPRKNQKT